MNDTKKLYQITAHTAVRSMTYYVIARSTTEAEQRISAFHQEVGYVDIHSFDAKTIAEANKYGKPRVLLFTNP